MIVVAIYIPTNLYYILHIKYFNNFESVYGFLVGFANTTMQKPHICLNNITLNNSTALWNVVAINVKLYIG